MAKDIKVGVVGGSGYAGLELVRLLHRHPQAALRICFSTHPEMSFADYLPHQWAKGIPVVDVRRVRDWAHELDTVFLATPAEISLELAPQILERGAHVIDLSGAFRLSAGGTEERLRKYQEWYQIAHPCPDLLERARYGLMPWYSGVPDDTASLGSRYPEGAGEFEPQLVANPGCYATSVLMAVLPLLKRDLIEPDSLVIDAKSGTSGAGRKPSENLLFTEVEGECLPYRLGKHQHYPEICQYAAHFSGVAIEPFFTTHLLSVRRGIITGLYAKLRENVTEADLDRAYGLDYADYGLVEWGALNGLNARSVAHRLSLKRVVGSAMTRLHYQVDGRRLYLFSLIDNLVKGAAGQAIENFNRIRGLALGTGLKELEGVL